jgi:hypothetical protein
MAAASYRALFYRDFGLAPLFAALGGIAGVAYTGLEPTVRFRPGLRYLRWILLAYLILGGGIVFGAIKHDPMSTAMLESPWGVALLLVCGICGGYGRSRTDSLALRSRLGADKAS